MQSHPSLPYLNASYANVNIINDRRFTQLLFFLKSNFGKNNRFYRHRLIAKLIIRINENIFSKKIHFLVQPQKKSFDIANMIPIVCFGIDISRLSSN